MTAIEVKQLEDGRIWIRINNLSHHLQKTDARMLYFHLQSILLEGIKI